MKNYSISGVKTFVGREGHGYNAHLLCNGVKVAFLIDDANGGPLNIQWLDYAAPHVQGAARDYKGEPFARFMTPQEAAFNALVFALPEVPCEYSESGKTFQSVDVILEEMVNDALTMKRLASILKKKTIFTKKGVKGAFSSTAAPSVFSIRPDVDIVLNLLPLAEALKVAKELNL